MLYLKCGDGMKKVLKIIGVILLVIYVGILLLDLNNLFSVSILINKCNYNNIKIIGIILVLVGLILSGKFKISEALFDMVVLLFGIIISYR